MLRITRTVALSTLALGASLSGCADNESSLFVEGMLSLPASDCVARPDAEAEFLSQGVMDLEFTNSYVAAVQVGNQITEQGNREKLRTETSRMHLEGATGTVFDVDQSEHSFDAIATGFVHPASGTTPGVTAMFVQLVNDEVSDELSGEGQIVVRFRVFGTTLGWEEVESGEYDFPISVCRGCLIEYPLAADNPALTGYQCELSAETTEEARICFRGQDQLFPCTECAAVPGICTDPSMNPWFAP
jgi:hypothetical protein